MLHRNRPHIISVSLDLTLENAARVTDVIGHKCAHQPECLQLLLMVTSSYWEDHMQSIDLYTREIVIQFHKLKG